MRIDKYLAHAGYGTRKEVKKLIRDGRVEINGVIVKNEKEQAHEEDIITLDDETVVYEQYAYFMLNKPSGYVSATSDAYDPTVLDLIDDYHKDLFPVGRLDKDSEGLMLISNDGKLAHFLLSPKHHVPKTYYVIVEGIVDEDDVAAFAKGIILDDMVCQSARLKIESVSETTSTVYVTIMEGKFHQIKRMFLSRQKKVTYLKRLSMGGLKLDPDLALGAYRPLTKGEIDSLRQANMV